jgi:hypothetical protein
MSSSSRGWGPGWPNCQTGSLVTLVCGVNDLRLPVRKEIAPIVAALVDDLERHRGRPFRPDWSWGFACRAIGGTRSPSNHSWGLAVDLDAPANPYQRGVRGPGVNDMPPNASAIAARYRMRWGGDYAVNADPMHFEFMGTPLEAAAIVRSLDQPLTPSTPTIGSIDMARMGDRGPAVAQLQHLLNRFVNLSGGGLDGGGISMPRGGKYLNVDGVFGDKTREFLQHAVWRLERELLGHPIYNPGDTQATAQTQAWLVHGIDLLRRS